MIFFIQRAYALRGDVLKKVCFVIFILAALMLFCLLSCGKSDTLYDILSESIAEEKTLPAGKILCYGRHYDNPISLDSLSDCLGIDGYEKFAERIEDFALFSTIQGDYGEVMLIRLYSVYDTDDAMLLLQRRANEIKRALNVSEKKGCGEAEIVKKGNTVALYMLPDGCAARKKIDGRI